MIGTRMSRDALQAYRTVCQQRIAEGIEVPVWREELARVEKLLAQK